METITSLTALKAMLKENRSSLLYISMPGCSVCTAVKPRLIQLAEDKQVPLYHVDAAAVPAVAGEWQILTAPAVLIFSYGKEMQRQARFIDFNKLAELLDSLAAADSSVNYETLFQ